jgi:2-aminoethylphosphonate-pyruvate transaminase
MQKQEIKKTIPRGILLNPGPATTSARVKSALIVEDICPREKSFGDLFRKVRRDAVELIHGGADYTSILLTSSGTGAMEACLGSAVPAGKKVLVLENGAYGKRMKEICKALGVDFLALDAAWGDPIDLLAVESMLKENKEEVGALAFIHHETTVGILNPLAELCEIARNFSLVTIVDAMSSYAGIPIDLRKTPVDYLLSSSNKCIQGMAGIGIVIAKKTRLEEISRQPYRGYYFNLAKNFEAQEKYGESWFTPPAQVVYALHEAFAEIREEGPESRYARYQALYRQMLVGMRALGFKTLVADEHHSGILTAFIEPNGFDFTAYHAFLFERGITVYPGKGAKEKTFRISNLGDLQPSDIELFLKVTAEFLRS